MTTRSEVYGRFDRATAKISAHAIFSGSTYVARVVFKHSDLSVRAFVQVWGAPMVEATARGGGYDHASAAFESAVAKLCIPERLGEPESRHDAQCADTITRLQEAARGPEGERWGRRVEAAGLTVAHVTG